MLAKNSRKKISLVTNAAFPAEFPWFISLIQNYLQLIMQSPTPTHCALQSMQKLNWERHRHTALKFIHMKVKYQVILKVVLDSSN